jgi:cation transport regulator
MRYESINDLPETLQDILPEEAQQIYLEAYQKSYDRYKEERGGQATRESVAHRDGMAAVKREYVHDEETGNWYPKGEEPSEEEGDKGVLDELKALV